MAQPTNGVMVDLMPLSTPAERCTVLHTGVVDEETIQTASDHSYDHLPVLNHDDQLCGMIETKRAATVSARGEPLEQGSLDMTPVKEVRQEVELFELLAALGEHRAIVFRGSEGEHDSDWFALVTISDLNRHPFRAYLYPLFAHLESALAELIDRTHEDAWSWIRSTPTHRQPVIVGRWELDKRDGVDTTPLTGCELRDLLAVITGSHLLRTRLKMEDDSVWKKTSESLPDLRNDVMHPVRPLVTSTKRVRSLRRQLRRMVDFTGVVVEVIEEMRDQNQGRVRFRR
jgi:hypothetical protein